MADRDYILKNQGILAPNEPFETLYLAEDEIEKFMENYLKENPGTEIETRYLNQPPIELTQNIQVRWLRPETPEIPPIIIKQVDMTEPEQPPIRIIETRKQKEDESNEPIVIREKPPFIVIPEPEVAYVQNILKRETKPDKQIKIEHVRSDSYSADSNNNSSNIKNNIYEYEEHLNRDRQYSFEEHASIIDYEEEEYDEITGQNRFRTKPNFYEDEHQLRLYEEKLKQTLYEEYLLRIERERLEKKLSESGLLDERLRERSISQERFAHLSSRFPSTGRVQREEDIQQRLSQINEETKSFRQEYQTSSTTNIPNKNIYDNSSSNDNGEIPRTESQKRYFNDLKAYELYNEGIRDSSGDLITKSSSNNGGIRRHRITTIKKYYNSNNPSNNFTEKNVYVKNS